MARFVIDSTVNSAFTPSSYDTTNSVVRATSNTQHGLKSTGSTENYATLYLVTGASQNTYAYYNFDCSSIPQNAIINSVICYVRATPYSTNSRYQQNNNTQLSIGTDRLGTPVTYSDAYSVVTINDSSHSHDFTREDLNNIKVCLHSQRPSSGNYVNSTSVHIKFYGAELQVNYSIGHMEYDITVSVHTDYATAQTSYYSVVEGNSQTINAEISNFSKVVLEDNYVNCTSQLVNVSGNSYTYTLTNVTEDHLITIGDKTIDFDDDPSKKTVSISSINASTTPINGYYRYQTGTTQDIIIIQSDPNLTLALDNGVDISSSIVPYQTIHTVEYSVSGAGAEYDFYLNENGYYEPTGITQSTTNTVALARIYLELEVPTLVTIQYYGQLTSTRDYAIISEVDHTLSPTGNSDSNTNYKVKTSSLNTSTPVNINYDTLEGSHTIDFKLYRGNSTSTSVSHKLFFKVVLTPQEPTTNFKYTISNIQEDHSIVLVYGDVVFYRLNSSTSADTLNLAPSGDWVCLPDETYKLVMIPQNASQSVTVLDNNVDVTQFVERYETTDDGVTDVNYVYRIFNVNADHNIVVSLANTSVTAYHKVNGSYEQVTAIYKKINGAWVEQTDLTTVFEDGKVYFNQ